MGGKIMTAKKKKPNIKKLYQSMAKRGWGGDPGTEDCTYACEVACQTDNKGSGCNGTCKLIIGSQCGTCLESCQGSKEDPQGDPTDCNHRIIAPNCVEHCMGACESYCKPSSEIPE